MASELEFRQRLGSFESLYCKAPEALDGNQHAKSDMWSVGVITFMLLSGLPLVKGKTPKSLMQKLRNFQVTFATPEWKNVSKSAKEFIAKLLVLRPEKRISASEALQDEWIL